MNKPKLMYMMHPLGDGATRERNRKLACLWQAEIQRDHPDWVVLAPWIGLSGAWGEDLRELGMSVDFKTIDACDGGVIAGVLEGPVVMTLPHVMSGVSPGMSAELKYFADMDPDKPVVDVRSLYKVELAADWKPPIIRAASEFKPRFEKFQEVHVENKPGGVCHVKDIEETANGVYRYLIERTETFFAHEQALAHPNPGAGHKR